MTVATAARRSDRNKDSVGAIDRPFEVGRKGKTPGRRVRRDEVFEAGLIDRAFAPQQHVDLALILIDTDHVYAKLRKAGPGHQPDITGADHRDFHSVPISAKSGGQLLPSALSGVIAQNFTDFVL